MKLSDLKIVLASGSPRRLEMLEREGFEPYVMRTGCSEDIHLDLGPARTVMALALRKGLEAEQRVAAGEGPEYIRDGRPFVIISADTVVYKDGKIYGKPADEEEALAMLRDLSGDVHQVYSGVFLNIKGTAKKLLFYDRTEVFVKEVGGGWLASYVASGEPMDKAGGYAIQGSFGVNIDHIEGAYDNVVGLPLEKIKAVLGSVSISPF